MTPVQQQPLMSARTGAPDLVLACGPDGNAWLIDSGAHTVFTGQPPEGPPEVVDLDTWMVTWSSATRHVVEWLPEEFMMSQRYTLPVACEVSTPPVCISMRVRSLHRVRFDVPVGLDVEEVSNPVLWDCPGVYLVRTSTERLILTVSADGLATVTRTPDPLSGSQRPGDGSDLVLGRGWSVPLLGRQWTYPIDGASGPIRRRTGARVEAVEQVLIR